MISGRGEAQKKRRIEVYNIPREHYEKPRKWENQIRVHAERKKGRSGGRRAGPSTMNLVKMPREELPALGKKRAERKGKDNTYVPPKTEGEDWVGQEKGFHDKKVGKRPTECTKSLEKPGRSPCPAGFVRGKRRKK